MLIVLTSEQEIKNETTILNQLFEAGLQVLQLRKPNLDESGHRHLLNLIDSKFYNRIMIHKHHNLCGEFNLKGVHLKEEFRLNLAENLNDYIDDFKNSNFSTSSSFHKLETIASCKVNFDYHLLSPVFSSISKKDYTGKEFDVNHIEKNIVGVGGINYQTMNRAFSLGFKGVGVLGSVWNTENPVKNFMKLHQIYSSIKDESQT